MGTLHSLYPVRNWRASATWCLVEWSKIEVFDQENEKTDSSFANHSLKTQAFSIFWYLAQDIVSWLNYVHEVRF